MPFETTAPYMSSIDDTKHVNTTVWCNWCLYYSSLDVSYVSSLSWYLIILFGLRYALLLCSMCHVDDIRTFQWPIFPDFGWKQCGYSCVIIIRVVVSGPLILHLVCVHLQPPTRQKWWKTRCLAVACNQYLPSNYTGLFVVWSNEPESDNSCCVYLTARRRMSWKLLTMNGASPRQNTVYWAKCRQLWNTLDVLLSRSSPFLLTHPARTPQNQEVASMYMQIATLSADIDF